MACAKTGRDAGGVVMTIINPSQGTLSLADVVAIEQTIIERLEADDRMYQVIDSVVSECFNKHKFN